MTMLRAGAKIWNEIFHMCVLSTFLFMESSSFTVLTSPRLCPPNEVYKSCGGCEPTCLTSKIPVACTDVCRQGCQCIPGFLRNSDGKCVENCNGDCPPNQQYVTCGGCEPTCDVPKPEACLAVCIVGCQCLPGFLRDSDGNCVSTCPGKPCGENEELKKQASTCEPTCADRNPICNKMAVLNVCRCKDGYIRDVTGGRCIPVEKCPTGCQVDTCETIKCPPGTKCEQNTIFCIRAPCPQPPPQCVPITTVQPTTVTSPTSCDKIKCKPGEFCSVLFPLCLPDGPCPPPIARCYPRGGPEPV